MVSKEDGQFRKEHKKHRDRIKNSNTHLESQRSGERTGKSTI